MALRRRSGPSNRGALSTLATEAARWITLARLVCVCVISLGRASFRRHGQEYTYYYAEPQFLPIFFDNPHSKAMATMKLKIHSCCGHTMRSSLQFTYSYSMLLSLPRSGSPPHAKHYAWLSSATRLRSLGTESHHPPHLIATHG